MLSHHWRELIPIGPEARSDRERAERAIAELAAAPAPSPGAALVAPAEEIARSLLLHGLGEPAGVRQMIEACLPRLRAARADAATSASLDAALGVLAFRAVQLAQGDAYHHDEPRDAMVARQRAELDAVAAVIERAGRARGSDPAAARAAALALGAGDPALAARLAPGRCALRPVLDRPADPSGYRTLIADFAVLELTWVDLLSVAAALRVLVEGDDADPRVSTASWLHRAVRQGWPPRPAPRRAPEPPPPDPALLARAAALCTDHPPPRAPRTWQRLELDDRHGLWGGAIRRIGADGRVCVEEYPGGAAVAARVHDAWLTPAALESLDALVRAADAMALPPSTRLGIPDEVSIAFTLITEHERHAVRRWLRDPHPGFDPLRDWIFELGRALAAARQTRT